MTSAASPLEAFRWTPQPAAEALVKSLLAAFLEQCPIAVNLASRMRDETGTRFFDWLDHLSVPASPDLERRLRDAGFVESSSRVFSHNQGMFPHILLTPGGSASAAIKVESIINFLSAFSPSSPPPVDGEPGSQLRRARIGVCRSSPQGECSAVELWVVERHGYRGFFPPPFDPDRAVMAVRHADAFTHRQREFDDAAAAFVHASLLANEAISDIGPDWACDLFFAAERAYWQSRNRAAQVQKGRQDRLGLGWANHDHHTYRSSRQFFTRLIALLESFGFQCRERFYAGAQAGWGAQILEQPAAGIVVFADVDLSPDELFIDFAHEPLPPRHELGTVGLWCALHGEAILQAGMHHLECQFDFEALRRQLEQENIRVMKPFTNFPYLRQAFTEGERWPVAEHRLAALMARGQISPQQAEQFRTEGAIGSHLENLERNEGFKGFNQTGVSEIIARTDPRRNVGNPH